MLLRHQELSSPWRPSTVLAWACWIGYQPLQVIQGVSQVILNSSQVIGAHGTGGFARTTCVRASTVSLRYILSAALGISYCPPSVAWMLTIESLAQSRIPE